MYLLVFLLISFVSADIFGINGLSHVSAVSQVPPVDIPYNYGVFVSVVETTIDGNSQPKQEANGTIYAIQIDNPPTIKAHTSTTSSPTQIESYALLSNIGLDNATSEVWSIVDGGSCTRNIIPTPKIDCSPYVWKSDTFQGKSSMAATTTCQSPGVTNVMTTYYNPEKTALCGFYSEGKYPSLNMVIKATLVLSSYSSDKFGDDKVNPPSNCPKF